MCQITEALISPMDGSLPFRDNFSCRAAACHIEHHMVWHHATFSHEHRGRSFKWAMTGTIGDAAACTDFCFGIVCDMHWLCAVLILCTLTQNMWSVCVWTEVLWAYRCSAVAWCIHDWTSCLSSFYAFHYQDVSQCVSIRAHRIQCHFSQLCCC